MYLFINLSLIANAIKNVSKKVKASDSFDFIFNTWRQRNAENHFSVLLRHSTKRSYSLYHHNIYVDFRTQKRHKLSPLCDKIFHKQCGISIWKTWNWTVAINPIWFVIGSWYNKRSLWHFFPKHLIRKIVSRSHLHFYSNASFVVNLASLITGSIDINAVHHLNFGLKKHDKARIF